MAVLNTVSEYNGVRIVKALGKFKQPYDSHTKRVDWPHADESIKDIYFLYHSRGPTVETKGFNPDNNHPFTYGDWIVAHNGIISNFESLGKKYFPEEDFTGKTDSCIIPRLLSIKSMSDALSELEGTFAVWMYNKKLNQLYLARSASTLFVNYDTGVFSSTEFEGSKALQEGCIYEIADSHHIIKVDHFKYDSPYFLI
jgi:glucosamine 6-phosphate synthetase-like amidotransferase/phosphosugar isomerase protein